MTREQQDTPAPADSTPKFHDLGELKRFIRDRLGRCDPSGLTVTGRWTPGQILHHLAAGFDRTMRGGPGRRGWLARLRRLPIRWLVLKRGIPAGRSIPSAVAAELTPPPQANFTAERSRLLRSIEAFEAHGGDLPVHPVVGPLTKAEWTEFHLRHCELHLGHIVVQGGVAAD
ncbi:MAG: DUF1569 domain-containing protein [Phycisphaeraceae bacterium]|nr:DUF1569 domain-containing protein [Phycisphaeraceae bacterium]